MGIDYISKIGFKLYIFGDDQLKRTIYLGLKSKTFKKCIAKI